MGNRARSRPCQRRLIAPGKRVPWSWSLPVCRSRKSLVGDSYRETIGPKVPVGCLQDLGCAAAVHCALAEPADPGLGPERADAVGAVGQAVDPLVGLASPVMHFTKAGATLPFR